MTNSSTPSEPSKSSTPTDDEPDDGGFQGYRVKVSYPDRLLFRYALRTENGWSTVERPQAQLFTDFGEARRVVETLSNDFAGFGIEVMAERAPSFDPDWCIPVGPHIKELCEHVGISEAQLAEKLGLSSFLFEELLAGRIRVGSKLSTLLAKHLRGTPTYWANLDTNYFDGLRMGRDDSP